MFERRFAPRLKDNPHTLKLYNGSQIAVIGGGPAGSFFSYFLLDLAKRVGMDVRVDIYERRDFSRYGPVSCNHCGGIISESLVQTLATAGINLPSKVVQRGVDSYILHMDVGSVRIETPLHEKRIAAVFRSAGPLGAKDITWGSFDGFLQELTVDEGAHLIGERVEGVNFEADRPLVTTRSGLSKTYDLVVGAIGVNSPTLDLFKGLDFRYKPPGTTKAFICEFHLEREMVHKHYGNSMHIFLLNVPRLKFAALIPKGNFVTMCLLGEEIDKELVDSFLNNSVVKQCFPPEWDFSKAPSCQCFPHINIQGAIKPFADRMVLIGDSAVTRLYKDGIGAAYYTAKAAATTVIFHGVSSEDFKQHYWPICKSIETDNTIGKVIFAFTQRIQKRDFSKRGILRMVTKEQSHISNKKLLSIILWDTFTGSASYKDIFLRTLNPAFQILLLVETLIGISTSLFRGRKVVEDSVGVSALGKEYQDGEIIINQGEEGDCMYVIQSGKVEIIQIKGGKEVRLAELSEGDFFGEMALFEREVRSTVVRAQGKVRVLTVDKKNLLNRIEQDPSMAFRILQELSSRIRRLNAQLSRIKASDRRNWDARPEDWVKNNIADQ